VPTAAAVPAAATVPAAAAAMSAAATAAMSSAAAMSPAAAAAMSPAATAAGARKLDPQLPRSKGSLIEGMERRQAYVGDFFVKEECWIK